MAAGAVVHDRAVAEAELLIEVGVEADDGQVRLSVTGADAEVPGRGDPPRGVVSGPGAVLVAARSDGPVTVRVYDGRPDLHGWVPAHTARLVVGTDGVDVGTVGSAVDHWVPVEQGAVTVEVWVRGPGEPGEVTFVLSR